MDGVSSAASVLGVVDISLKVAALLFQYSKEVKNAKADIARVQLQVDSLKNASQSVEEHIKGPNSAKFNASQKLKAALDQGRSQLSSLEQRLQSGKGRKAMSRFGIRALKWPFDSKDIEKTVQGLSTCTQAISMALQADQMAVLLALDRTIVLDKLPTAEGAAFDSQAEESAPMCLQDTRVELLREIREWADGTVDQSETRAIFWLNGMAGTGKSTISRTVARHFADSHRLGASFFFKQGDGDRGKVAKFFTTIAAQLVSALPAVAVHIKNAIESDPGVVRKAIREQFEKLVFGPLSNVTPDASPTSALILVIDALDECERDDDIKLVINLLSRARSLMSSRLKIFVTSRPELPIRLGFNAIHGKYQDLVLHKIPKPVVERDISAYLHFEFTRIRDEYNASVSGERQLPPSWPDEPTIQTLVEMAVPLFIFAATVCRFVDDRRCGDPDKQLREVLNFDTKSQASKLDATYLPVLNQLLVPRTGHGILPLNESEKHRMIDDFRKIVGPIVILASPLPAASLARLLGISRKQIDSRLDLLHSVLSIPTSSSTPVRLLHLSFRDFLLDPEKRHTNPFWIDEQDTHQQLVAYCLHVMRECLRIDICALRAPGTRRSMIESRTIEANLPSELQYACLYWVYHVEQSQMPLSDGDQIHDFLNQYFLQWLEALSLIGRALESINLIKALQSLVKTKTQLSAFLNDAIRLVLANTFTIDSTPLQLYSSVLAFAPRTSVIRVRFKDMISNWISLQPEPETNWSQCLQILEGHVGSVSSVAFSHDSGLVASSSYDTTVRLWRSDTGECMQELKGHSDSVKSVAFSHDSALVASASYDTTVRLWRTDTGECVQELKGHSSWVTSVVFSHDSAIVASASNDITVRLWRSDTGECLHVLEGHNSSVNSVAFSHDSALVASASIDETVRLWRSDTGECVQQLKGHTSSVNSVAFSHDSALVASASIDETVRLWRSDTGECVQQLKGHNSSVNSVAFSHDSALVASASYDETVRLWRTDTGECVQELKGHSSWVTSVAFSHDSAILASASNDMTVRLWQSDTGEYIHVLEGHNDWVKFVAFSHDSTLVASSSYDTTVRLWRSDTGECVQQLKGHSDPVRSVAFSHDSAIVASASYDKTVRLWRSDTGECLHVLKGHSDLVRSVAFSHDSTLVVSASGDKTMRLWRSDTGECVLELKGHSDSVNSVAFSHDSALIASASYDATVRLWRTDTGECVQKAETGPSVYCLSFDADGSHLLTSVGRIVVNKLSPAGRTTVDEAATAQVHRFGYGFSRDSCWILWHGHDLLWLPAEFRPIESLILGCTAVIGCNSGRVLLIRFDTERVDTLFGL